MWCLIIVPSSVVLYRDWEVQLEEILEEEMEVMVDLEN